MQERNQGLFPVYCHANPPINFRARTLFAKIPTNLKINVVLFTLIFPASLTMTFSLFRKSLASAFLLIFSNAALAALNLSDPIPVGPQVKLGKLTNGLSYYIHQNAKPEKRVELRLVLKVGSILEDQDQQGLAHFTEHMAFNGSRHFKKHELISYLQSIGIKFGADLNAYTSFDETVYILPIPTDKKENLETSFQVLQDWAQGVEMQDAAIDQERDIILEEARLGKGAGDRMNKQLLPALFNGSKYAERLPIGKETILKTFKYDAIKRFYADWYRPDLMAVVVVGDVDPDSAEKMIHAYFDQLKNPVHERARDYTKILERSVSSGLVVTDKEATNNTLMLRYPFLEKKPEAILADYRQSMLKGLVTEMLAQRLQELTQQENPPFLGGASTNAQIVTGYESFTSYAVLGRGGIEPAIAALVQENERARQFGFSTDELERSKKNKLRRFEQIYSERDKSNSANYAAEYIRNFLVGESIPGTVNEYAYVNQILPEISLTEVNAYVRQMIPVSAKKLVAYMGSNKAGESIPTVAQLLSVVEAAEKTPVLAKDQKAVAKSLMAQLPKAGTIISETQNKALGLSELTLSNGLKVILKPSDFKNDQILLSATRFGGQSLFAEKDTYNARYANAVVGVMGLKDFAPIEVQKILAGKNLSFQLNMGNYTEQFYGTAGNADLEAMFQVLHLRLASPRRDEALYKAFISKAQDQTRNSMSHPETVFGDILQTTMYQDHPRLARAQRPEDFGRIDLERALQIYCERFGSARGLTFILVGSFEVEQIKPLIATYLASLPTPEIVTGYKDMGMRPVSGVVKKEVRVGSEQKSRVSLNFTGPISYSNEEQLRFHALIDIMNLRINEVLREKLTLIYSGAMGGEFDRIPYPNYNIGISLPCGPENVAKVIAAMFGEIEKIKQEGPQAADLNKVKQNWIKERQIALRTNNLWLQYLQDSTLYGYDPALILSYDKRVDALTSGELQEAAKRYFNMENYVQAVLYPEK